MNLIQALKIDIRAVEDVDCAGFNNEFIEEINVVSLSFCNPYKTRDRAAQVEKRMQLDSGFLFSETRPRKERKTQVNRGGVKRVSDRFEFGAELFVAVKFPCLIDENLSKVSEDAIVSGCVRVGKGVA